MTIKNEKGYTLILVLIIITVIFILAMSLSGMAISTRMQFNKTDDLNKTTDLAEMGITYYQTAINSLIQPAKDAANTKINTSFCAEFNNLNNQNKNNQTVFQSVDGQNGYQITIKSASSVNDCITNNRFNINFESKGITKNGEFKILEGTLTISNQSKAGTDAPRQSDYTPGNNFLQDINSTGKIIYNDPIKENKTYAVNNSSAWFNSFTLNGQGSFHFLHDVIFDYFSMNNPTDLTIDGNTIFLNPDNINKKTIKAEICITGNIYKISNNKLVDFTDYSNYFTNTCRNSTSGWSIDSANGLTVQY